MTIIKHLISLVSNSSLSTSSYKSCTFNGIEFNNDFGINSINRSIDAAYYISSLNFAIGLAQARNEILKKSGDAIQNSSR